MVTVVATTILAVITMNFHYRSSSTHDMSRFTRVLFFHILPKILLLQKPDWEPRNAHIHYQCDLSDSKQDMLQVSNPYRKRLKRVDTESDLSQVYGIDRDVDTTFIGGKDFLQNANLKPFCGACHKRQMQQYPPTAKMALNSICFVGKHITEDDSAQRVSHWVKCRIMRNNISFDCTHIISREHYNF